MTFIQLIRLIKTALRVVHIIHALHAGLVIVFSDICHYENYSCFFIRSKLFLTKHVLRHTEGFEFESEKFEKRIEYYQHLNNSEKLCDKMIHIEPLAWFEDNMRNSIGKVFTFTIK